MQTNLRDFHQFLYPTKAFHKKSTLHLQGAFDRIQLVQHEGQKSSLTGTLNSGGQLSLVLSAGAGYTAGKNLCVFRDELSELCNVFVVDSNGLFSAEKANFLSSVHRSTGRTGRIISVHNERTFLAHEFSSAKVVSLAFAG